MTFAVRKQAGSQCLLVSTVGAKDVSSLGYETLVGQTEGAFLTVEAVFVPGAALIVHHVHTFTKT